ncbi:MAG: hypothetical protein WBD20_26025 [Pirellulaceae bacterium]
MSFRFVVSSMVVLVVVVMGMFDAGSVAQAQDKVRQSSKSQQAMMEFAQLQRMAFDPKLADELELTPDQKKEIQIATQKYQDQARKMARPKPGEKPDLAKFQKLAETMMKDTEGLLSEKQKTKLSEMAKQRTNTPRPAFSNEKMQEMQKLSSMMQELMRLSYDVKLAEELEVTAEQRVEIREAQQKFQQAMRDRMNAGQGQAFDMDSYNEMIGSLMMDAQEILTPEQSEKLARSAKLKRLKQKFGDEFAMINGLAEDFDLDAKQTLELREKIAEVREDFYDKYIELKKKSMEEIIRELPKEHREEVEAAVREFLNDDPREKRNPFSGAIRVGG